MQTETRLLHHLYCAKSTTKHWKGNRSLLSLLMKLCFCRGPSVCIVSVESKSYTNIHTNPVTSMRPFKTPAD